MAITSEASGSADRDENAATEHRQQLPRPDVEPAKTGIPGAAETTYIPVDSRAGHHGAIAYLAVLCYPGTDARSHHRRNQLTTAILEYIRGIVKYRAGFRRITRSRAKSAASSWLRRPPAMKNEQVFSTGNKAESILRNQRIPCAWIAMQLGIHQFSSELRQQGASFQICTTEPQTLTGLIEYKAERLRIDPRTLWRYWNETLPVLHLATEFYFSLPKQRWGDRPQLVILCARDHQRWLAEAVKDAEARALDLPTYTTFDPAKRICLLPE